MKTEQEIYDILKEKFGEEVLEFVTDKPIEKYIVVAPNSIKKISEYLRFSDELFFDSLMVLSGVDDANGEKVSDEDGSVTIKGGTLSVFYHLHSMKYNNKVNLKVSVPRETPEVPSVMDVWSCADWHEREAYDLLGIIFTGHTNLIRILMPYDWEAGHPLRKDYKNPEFYQGMKVPY